MPVTTPVVDIVPVAEVTLLHKPPVVPSVRGKVNVWQMGPVLPVIAAGSGMTVATASAAQMPSV